MTEIGGRAFLAPLPWIRQCKAPNAILTRLRIEILGRAPAGKTKKHEICVTTFNGYIFIRYFYKKKRIKSGRRRLGLLLQTIDSLSVKYSEFFVREGVNLLRATKV